MSKTIEQIQEKINQQQQKLEQLRARKKLLEARSAADSRKVENRRKILAGAVILKAVEIGKISKADFLHLMDQGLTREVDRRLFFPDAETSFIATQAKP